MAKKTKRQLREEAEAALEASKRWCVKFSQDGTRWFWVTSHGGSPLDADAAIDYKSRESAQRVADALGGPRGPLTKVVGVAKTSAQLDAEIRAALGD